MDKLEEHIRKNREALDRYSPPAGVWNKINRQINSERFHVRRLLSIAAMFIVIIGSSLFLIKPWLSNKAPNQINRANIKNPFENSQLQETEIYYNNLINSLYLEATPMLTGYPEIKKELSVDLSHLDSICNEIKKDLKDNIANQEVVEALIQNYRIKIRLLEDMLAVLKEAENNQKKKENHEL
jgi:hypothetical protein